MMKMKVLQMHVQVCVYIYERTMSHDPITCCTTNIPLHNQSILLVWAKGELVTVHL